MDRQVLEGIYAMSTRSTPMPLSVQLPELSIAIAVAASPSIAKATNDFTIDKAWSFRMLPGDSQLLAHPDAGRWHAAAVPGTVHTDLLAGRLIVDTYVGAPEAELQWIGQADWEYRTSFDAPRDFLGRSRSELVFEGLDTFAEVYLNDDQLLLADNAFRTWRVPVQGRLRARGNELRVVFRSPINKLLPAVQAMSNRLAGNYPSPYGDEPKDAMTGNFVRKPGYHYGWDWGPRYVTAGITKPVVLRSWDVVRIDDLQLRQPHVDELKADIVAIGTVDAVRGGRFDVSLWQIDPQGVRVLAAHRRAQLRHGVNRLEFAVQVDRPQRWFPAGYGAQPLYRFELEVNAGGTKRARLSARTGLRSIELCRDADATGRSFHFVVNGIPIFAKGANVIPFDMFQPRVTRAQLRRVLESARDANMNFIRNWGGGYYESEQFFDLADELGLLVWQDFMFGGGMQPAYDDQFRAGVAAEARDQVRRLRNHPSIVLWCGNNEEEIAWKYWGHGKALKEADPAFAQRVWSGYEQLFDRDLRQVVAEEGGGVPYWPSSPSDDMAEQANIASSGDMHYWEVWGNPAYPPTKYLEITPRFMSEYGLQAWPVPRTIDAIAPRDQQHLDSPVIRAHQKFLAGEGNERLLHYIRMEFGEPAGFEDFVYLSQAMQAEGIGLAALHHRASRPHTMGSLYWQLNDVWPGASWSSIDWFGRWKALQFHARRFFAPVAIAAMRDAGGNTSVSVLNDRPQPVRAELRLRVIALDGSVLREDGRWVDLAPLSATKLASYTDAELLRGADPTTTVAVFDLQAAGESASREVVYFAPAKDMAWLPSGVHSALRPYGLGHELEISVASLARGVWLEFEGLEVELSDNALTLLPEEHVILRLTSQASSVALRTALRIRTVGDAMRAARSASYEQPEPLQSKSNQK